MPLSRLLPDRIFAPIGFAHSLVWGAYAAWHVRSLRADAYYTRDIPVALSLVEMKLPTVLELHLVPRRVQRRLLERVVRHPALRLAVALTSFIRESLAEIGCPEQRILVLPDAVDLRLFDQAPSRAMARRQLGLPPDRPIVGYVGRFRTMDMEKGIPELIEAIAHLATPDGAEPLLLCVGGPMTLVPAYLDLARRHGIPESRLRFVDRVPNVEVPAWIRACDVVTIPWPRNEFSAYFTSPMKLFEYLAAGVPIVSSDLPSIREIVTHGDTAWLVEPGNPRALATGITRLLSDTTLGERLAARGRQLVERHTWADRARRVIEAFASLDHENVEP